MLVKLIPNQEKKIEKKNLEIITSSLHQFTLFNKDYAINYDHIDFLKETDDDISLIGISGLDWFGNITPIKLKVTLISYIKKKNIFNFKDLFILEVNARAVVVLVINNEKFLVSYIQLQDNKARLVVDYFKFKNKNLIKETVFTTKFLPLNSEMLNDKKDNLNLKEKFLGIHQAGGKIEIVSDSKFIIGIGDFNNEHLLVKDIDYFGKMILVDIKTKKIKLLSRGLRNPQGLSRLSEDTYISTEHGMVGGDEINIIEENNHYGWPYESLGHAYGMHPKRKMTNNLNNSEFGNHESYVKPLFSFLPDIGIKDIQIYPDNKDFDRWGNDLLICSAHGLFRLRPNQKNKLIKNIMYVEKIHKYSCRDMAISDSGYIFFNDLSYIMARKLY